MTYDELRDYIDKFDAAGMVNQPEVKALRAVVELHRPMPLIDDCYGCRQADPYLNKVWPCETIEAIEKELA